MAIAAKSSKKGQNSIWLIPVILTLILSAGVGGFFGYSAWKQHNEEQISSQEEQQRLQQEMEAELERRAEIIRLESKLDVASFYEGIYIGEHDLAGLTYSEAEAMLLEEYESLRNEFSLNIAYEQEEISISAADASFNADWRTALDYAWQIGRTSSKQDYLDQLRDRNDLVEALKTEPVRIPLVYQFDQTVVWQRVYLFARSFDLEPRSAIATGFNVRERKFEISEQVLGRRMNSLQAANSAVEILRDGKYGKTIELEADILEEGYDAASIAAATGHVSTAKTYAYAVNVNRDINIDLICKTINGLVLQPGEVFSFNGYIGERTAAKGYKEAGGISQGILVEELGGGICQPNTTLCHAVLKAGLEIVERHPHSWPSTYAPIGLDATVSWRGPDFKFRNNTNYPLAIVAWYDKPAVNVQIYGMLLEDGVTISLDSAIVEEVPIPEPEIIERLNEELEPGEKDVVRDPYIGRRTVAWRIWKKDGKVIEREEIFRSYYRPLQGIVEYGPEPEPDPEETTETLPPEETTTETEPAETEPEPTEETTTEETTTETDTEPTTADEGSGVSQSGPGN